MRRLKSGIGIIAQDMIDHPPSGHRFPAAHRVLEEAVRARAFPGAAYGVLLKGNIAALDAVGRFTFDSESPRVAPLTLFDLASVTKVFATTAIAMLLYDRKLLNIDSKLGDILPAFVADAEPGSGKHLVTIRSLLAHSSGLPGYVRLFERHRSPEAMMHAALALPLEVPPNTREEYSDIGFILLGRALEVLARQRLDTFFESQIAAPLGLETARFCPPRDRRNQIPPTEKDASFRRRVIQGEVQDENCFALGGVAGNTGLFSNCRDLLRFAGCLLANGKTESGRPLFQPETVKLFATRQSEPAGTSRALGWDTPSQPSSSGKHFSPQSIGHLGFSGTSLWIDPVRRLAVVLLTNRTWPDRANTAIYEVRPAFHDAVAADLKH